MPEQTPSDSSSTPPAAPPPVDPFDMSGRRDFGIVAVAVVSVIVIGAGIYTLVCLLYPSRCV